MEEDLKKKWKITSKKMEDDLKKNGRRTKIEIKMEDDLQKKMEDDLKQTIFYKSSK